MTPYETFIKNVFDFAARHSVSMDDRLIHEGSPTARVMLVGWQIGDDETKPFGAEGKKALRGFLSKMNVGPEMVLLTNLIKVPQPVMSLGDTRVGTWVVFLFEEIKVVIPLAVSLLGLPVAAAVLRLTDDSIEKVRSCHFMWPGRTQTHFFATYAPEEITFPNGGMSIEGINWITDIKAVFEADETHFNRIRTVKG